MTTIVFEQFSPSIDADGNGRFSRLRGLGAMDTYIGAASFPKLAVTGFVGVYPPGKFPKLVGVANAVHPARFSKLRGVGLVGGDVPAGIAVLPKVSGYAFVASFAPTIIAGIGGLPGPMRGSARARIASRGDAALPRLRGVASLDRYVQASAFKQLRGFAVSTFPVSSYVAVFQSPGYVFSTDDEEGIDEVLLFDLGVFSDVLALLPGIAFDDHAAVTDSLGLKGNYFSNLSDKVTAQDTSSLVVFIVLAATVQATDTLGLDRLLLVTMVDTLLASDSLLTLRQAQMAIATTVVAKDSGGPFTLLRMLETATASDQLVALVHRILQLTDTATASDTVTGLLSMLMVTSDTVTATDVLSGLRAALMDLNDSAFIGGHFLFDGIDYVVYAVQPQGAMVSEYTGWRYESMTIIDGVPYGAGADGLDELSGDTDNGEKILAEVRTGLSNFGTALTKNVPEVVIGYNGAGRMLCKVISTAKGVMKENWYQLSAIPRGAVTNARFTISKNLHSQYFGFALGNVDGEDFDLDFAQAWVLVLNRRI